MRRVNVSTHCPMCGAPIDFHAGVNALKCTHCRSHLLVTGRKQVLSYSVTPKIGAHAAVERAKPAAEGARIVTIELYFVPYYRFTAQEFCWQRLAAKPPSAPLAELTPANVSAWATEASGIDSDLVANAVDWISDFLFPKSDPVPIKPVSGSATQRETTDRNPRPSKTEKSAVGIEIVQRHIDKTFVATRGLEGKSLYSVGARSSVLRLDLFRRKRLETMGKVVAPTLASDVAMVRGAQRNSTAILHREVVGRILSLIYFPYWVVEIDRDGATLLVVIDGVSGVIAQRAAPRSLYDILDRREDGEPAVLGFRPLCCPNCRADLPMNPDDVVFLCSVCGRAWQLEGNQMSRVPHRIATAEARAATRGDFLPFWVLDQANGRRFFIPAFKYRGLEALYRMAARLSAENPSFVDVQTKAADARGCYYDQEDAMRLARFAYYAGELAKNPGDLEKSSEFPVSSATLVWFEFERRGEMLLDPFAGLMLYANALR